MKRTQEEMILNHLKLYGSITSWDAITQYRITRISSIIFNLRGQGYDIITEHKINNGKNYGVYKLIEAKQLSFI